VIAFFKGLAPTATTNAVWYHKRSFFGWPATCSYRRWSRSPYLSPE
jgi:hypothetical protein